jgi:predicted aldo/keto reductase-like oxidoreductase
MQYRPFGKLDVQVSALGFGAMRMPKRSEDERDIDRPEAIRMIRRAIDAGVDYLDTAWGYHGGASEGLCGEALRDGYGERVMVASKLPTWLISEERPRVEPFLDEQLRRLGRERIDVYLLHALAGNTWETAKRFELLRQLEDAQRAGKIGHIAFSFHGDPELFREIVDAYPWAMAQIQYNWANTTVQAGAEGLRHAAARGLAVVVMEPLLGGELVDPPPAVKAALERVEPAGMPPVGKALHWLWDQPEVSCVLSGMSTMEQLEENLGYARQARVGRYQPADQEHFQAATDALFAAAPFRCTACRYCLPCPQGVDIPTNLRLEADAVGFEGRMDFHNGFVYQGMAEEKRASACVACGACEERCPQGIEIASWMPKIAERFTRE